MLNSLPVLLFRKTLSKQRKLQIITGDLIRIFFTIVSYIQNNLHNNNNKHISDLCGAKFYSLAIA